MALSNIGEEPEQLSESAEISIEELTLGKIFEAKAEIQKEEANLMKNIQKINAEYDADSIEGRRKGYPSIGIELDVGYALGGIRDEKIANAKKIAKENILDIYGNTMGAVLHANWAEDYKLNQGSERIKVEVTNGETIKWLNDDVAIPEGFEKISSVDIANTDFNDLPAHWQKDNFEAAKTAINICQEAGEQSSIDELATIVHEKWLENNQWAYEYSPELAVPFDKLSDVEKNKDRQHVKIALNFLKK